MLANSNYIMKDQQQQRLNQREQEEFEALLNGGAETTEALQIIQPDGSRACISYELAGQGFSLVSEAEMNKSYR
jgi:hypothetical protein